MGDTKMRLVGYTTIGMPVAAGSFCLRPWLLCTVLAGVIVIACPSLAGTYSGGSGTAEDPYQISTVTDWQELIAASADWDKHFILLNDIDFGGMSLTPVAPDTDPVLYGGFQGTPFSGVFNGGGCVLRNASINWPNIDYVGLFGYLNSDSRINNLGIENIIIYGRSRVGGLCGSNCGKISRSHVTGTVMGEGYTTGGLCGYNDRGTIIGCYSTCTVLGGKSISDLGGLCGGNTGTINACYATGDVSGNSYVGGLCGFNQEGVISNCYATGTVRGTDRVGGLCGDNNWDSSTISNCYSRGAVTGNQNVGGLCGANDGTLSNSYAMGLVSGGGGLCGYNEGWINGCFWDMMTSGQINSSGGTGKTTSEMKTLSTFMDAAWDFVHNWGIPAGDYPRLLWELVGFGSLQVTIIPLEAVGEGAQWRRVGTTDWLDSGQIETSVVAVSWDVEFKRTAHYRESEPIHVSVSTNKLTQTEAAYVTPGSLQVTILPSEAVAEGAQWRRVGTSDWLNSGQIETPVLAVDWDVEFKPIANWIGPQVVQVLVSPNELTQVQTAYIAPGSLQVIILPSEVVTAGAQWRRVGTSDWLDSGQIEAILAMSSWDVEFKPTSGWLRPESIQVLISSNELTQKEASYMELHLGGSGTEADPYQISTVADWQELIAASADWDKQFILLNDIDFGGADLTPVAPDTDPATDGFQGTAFTGVFDGNDHTLTNASINLPHSDYVGLFGGLSANSQIRNLGVDCITVTGWSSVGGLCGGSSGTISGCYVTGNISGGEYKSENVGGLCGENRGTISGCYAKGNISGGFKSENVGGLCGANGGTISSCFAMGSVRPESDSRDLGGLCGSNSGTINTSYTTGDVDGGGTSENVGGLCGQNIYGTISNSYSTGMICGGGYVGGLCGENYYGGTISNCYATGTVSGGGYVGVLCGENYSGSTISNCYATGTVSGDVYVGGLCGANCGTISNCYAMGEVNGSSVGGLCGTNYRTISGCFWDMETSRQTTSDGGTGKTTAEMKTLSTFTDAGWDFTNTWWMPIGDYPRLQWQSRGSLQVTIVPVEAVAEGAQWRLVGANDWLDSGDIDMFVAAGILYDVEFKPTAKWMGSPTIQIIVSPNEMMPVRVFYADDYSGGSGTEGSPYQISTASQWCMLTLDSDNRDKHFVLVNDIDFGGANLTPVTPDTDPSFWSSFDGTPFTGVFDGNGHVLRNAVINLPGRDYVGLFGCLGSGGQIRNLGVENVAVTGRYHVGGLCGANGDYWSYMEGGMIRGCYIMGLVTGLEDIGGLCGENYQGLISGCYAMSTVKGNDNSYDLGGLCGWNYGTISGCYATGIVSGDSGIGGLCGDNWGTISQSYATGTVRGTGGVGGLCGGNYQGLISGCYATGAVSGGGGLCGENYYGYGTINDCFWDMETSGCNSSDGGEGKTTAEMKTLSTFTDVGWDFVGESTNGTADTWRMCANDVDYPRLAWEFSHGGDFDCPDGVALDDLLYLAARWLAANPETIGAADANHDGKVDLSDFTVLGDNWLRN
jgi:hypothetical protein